MRTKLIKSGLDNCAIHEECSGTACGEKLSVAHEVSCCDRSRLGGMELVLFTHQLEGELSALVETDSREGGEERSCQRD